MIAVADIPLKCRGPEGAGIEPNPCKVPGSTDRCLICPQSPTYFRRDEIKTSEGASE